VPGDHPGPLQARQPHWIESHVISTTTPVRRSEPAAISSIFYPPAMSRNRIFRIAETHSQSMVEANGETDREREPEKTSVTPKPNTFLRRFNAFSRPTPSSTAPSNSKLDCRRTS
jgi:hypothetical protein